VRASFFVGLGHSRADVLVISPVSLSGTVPLENLEMFEWMWLFLFVRVAVDP
jgi:hypothetical protein